MFELAGNVSFLVLEVFIRLEELVERVVELDLLLLHGHEHFERVLELGKFLVLSLLLGNKNVDLFSKSVDFTILIIFVYWYQNTVHAKHVICSWLWNVAQKFFNVTVGSQKDLHLGADRDVSILTALLNE